MARHHESQTRKQPQNHFSSFECNMDVPLLHFPKSATGYDVLFTGTLQIPINEVCRLTSRSAFMHLLLAMIE